jgi:ABC-2 type transport system ATP-binding protein
MTDRVIDVHGLTKIYNDVPVVNHIDLFVNRGEIYGFLGPNGSGKTTTMRMLCGLLKPDAGDGTCLGLDIIHQAYQIKSLIGYMSQRFSLYGDLNAYENLQFMANAYNLKISKNNIQDALKRFNFTPLLAKKLARELSGGWKQRLALASVMMHKPQLLLLDEPTAGVDPQARSEFWDSINQFASEGMTILVSTHYMDEAERCNRLTYIAYGDILAVGTVDEVVDAQHLFAYEKEGRHLMELKHAIETTPGVRATILGNRLHLVSHQQQTLKQIIEQYDASTWRVAQPTLEDAFIDLVEKQQEETV